MRWAFPGIVIAFVLGLLMAIHKEPPFFLLLLFLLSTMTFYALSILMPWRTVRSGLPFFFLVGLLQGYLLQERPLPKDHIGHLVGEKQYDLEGIVRGSPLVLQDRTRIIIDVKRLIHNAQSRRVQGRLLLTIGEGTNSIFYGDRIRIRTSLRHPRNFGNPGRFDYVKWLKRRGVFVTGYIRDTRYLIVLRRNEGNRWIGWIEGWRRKIERSIEEALSSPSREIIKALILGKSREIPMEMRDRFSFAGASHLLAISGLHMGLIVLFSFALFKNLFKQFPSLLMKWNIDKLTAILSLIPLVGYGIVAGMRIATVRAVIMTFVLFLSLIIGRTRGTYHAIAMAALVILLVSPNAIFEVSFQLSFAAVLAICLIVPPLADRILREDPLLGAPSGRLVRWSKGFTIFALTSFAAILGTFPIAAYHFNQMSYVGIFTNIICIPLVGFLILPLALAGSTLALFWQALAFIPFKISEIFVLLLVKVVTIMASIPYGSRFIVTPRPWEIVLFYSVIPMWIWGKRFRKMRWVFMIPIMLISVSILIEGLSPIWSQRLRVDFISVGNGSSTLIRFPGGKRMLIDGGGTYDGRFDIGRKVVAPFLWKKRINRIDELVLTHPHPDHMNGLKFLVRHFQIGRLWISGEGKDTPSYAYREFERIVNERKIPVWIVGTGDEETIGGVKISVLHPPKGRPFQQGATGNAKINNNSLVLKIAFGEKSFLFPGDIEKEAEGFLVRQGGLKSTVLLIPHHGSLTSSTEAFLDAVSQQFAVISAGRGLGLSHRKVLGRLGKRGVPVYRTDLNGAVTFTTDGRQMQARSFLPVPPTHNIKSSRNRLNHIVAE